MILIMHGRLYTDYIYNILKIKINYSKQYYYIITFLIKEKPIFANYCHFMMHGIGHAELEKQEK